MKIQKVRIKSFEGVELQMSFPDGKLPIMYHPDNSFWLNYSASVVAPTL